MRFVGYFDEKDLQNGEDKKAVEKAQSETGLKYTETKITKRNGKTVLAIWVCSAYEFTI